MKASVNVPTSVSQDPLNAIGDGDNCCGSSDSGGGLLLQMAGDKVQPQPAWNSPQDVNDSSTEASRETKNGHHAQDVFLKFMAKGRYVSVVSRVLS